MRFRSKPIAALSIVLVLVGALGGWHTPDDADAYAPISSTGSHEVRATTQAQPTAPEHCALCHWLQALGKAAPAATQVQTVESFQLIHARTPFEHVRTTARLALPSRAPPLV